MKGGVLTIGGNAGPFRYRAGEWESLLEFAKRLSQAWGTRSLNIAVAAGIALAEALRQTESWPKV